jgi:hypothetical protein
MKVSPMLLALLVIMMFSAGVRRRQVRAPVQTVQRIYVNVSTAAANAGATFSGSLVVLSKILNGQRMRFTAAAKHNY